MKKILLLAFVICISVFANSQVIVPKGKKILGGSLRFSAAYGKADTVSGGPSVRDQKQFYAGVTPAIGIVRKNNVVQGFLLLIEYSKWESMTIGSPWTSDGHNFTAGPGVFYERFFPLSKSFHFSAMGSLSVTYGSIEHRQFYNVSDWIEDKGKSLAGNFSILPRIGYSFNYKWMVQASVGELLNLNYQHTEIETKSSLFPERRTNENSWSIQSRFNRGINLGRLGLTLRYTF